MKTSLTKVGIFFLLYIATSVLSSTYAQEYQGKERAMSVYTPPSKKGKTISKEFRTHLEFATTFWKKPKYFNKDDISDFQASTNLYGSYGYFFNPHFYLAPGAGLRFYSQHGPIMLPVYAEARGYWNRFYIYGRAGYSLYLSKTSNTGGAYAAAGVGCIYFSRPKIKLTISMGYEFQDHKYRHDTSGANLPGYNGLSLRFGTQF